MGREPASEHSVLESLARVRAGLERGDRRGTIFAAEALDDALLMDGRLELPAFEELQAILGMPEFMKSDGAYALLRVLEASLGYLSAEQIGALVPLFRRIYEEAAEEKARYLAATLFNASRRKLS